MTFLLLEAQLFPNTTPHGRRRDELDDLSERNRMFYQLLTLFLGHNFEQGSNSLSYNCLKTL